MAMKRVILKCGLALASVMAMSSCADMMLSTDFGYGDFYPDYSDYNWYWNSYPYYNNGFFGPPGPPPRPRPPQVSVPDYRPPASGNPGQANRPPVTTLPDGSQRPGNMGRPDNDRGRR